MKRAKREGIVVSHNLNKTATVEVVRVFMHPKYLKTVKSFKKFLVHDPDNKAIVGDHVEIAETRPISKRKSHRLLRIKGKAKLKTRELPKKKEVELKKTGEIEREKSDTTAN